MVLVGATAFLSVEPALFLVVLAIGLSAVTLATIALLVRSLLTSALGRHPRHCPVPQPVNHSDPMTQ
jgi:hypothetical protein